MTIAIHITNYHIMQRKWGVWSSTLPGQYLVTLTASIQDSTNKIERFRDVFAFCRSSRDVLMSVGLKDRLFDNTTLS